MAVKVIGQVNRKTKSSICESQNMKGGGGWSKVITIEHFSDQQHKLRKGLKHFQKQSTRAVKYEKGMGGKRERYGSELKEQQKPSVG